MYIVDTLPISLSPKTKAFEISIPTIRTSETIPTEKATEKATGKVTGKAIEK